jgi:preprotein translocase subunit SecG
MSNSIFQILNLAQWITDSFRGIQAVLVVLMVLACIVMIIAILVSPPQTGIGNNAITGAAESYYTKNKGKNNEGRIRLLIVICASMVAVCAILYFTSFAIYRG